MELGVCVEIKPDSIDSINNIDTINTILFNKEDIVVIIDEFFNNKIVSKDELFDNELFDTVLYSVYNTYMGYIDNKHILMSNNLEDCKMLEKNDLINIISIELKERCGILLDPVYNESDIEYMKKKITFIENVPQPEQRTDEWYIFRHNRLTASDLYNIMEDKKTTKTNKQFSSKYIDTIIKKCEKKQTFLQNPAILHGVKCEPLATQIYETRYNLNIIEFGCIPHPFIEYFGASPDGIVGYNSSNKNYIGRMLEIKCPKSRPITGLIPPGYYAQIQGQLEVCDLEYCDYLECDFKFYKNEVDFFGDIHKDTPYLRKNGNEKGIIIELYNRETKKYIYHYSELNHIKSIDNYKKWSEPIINSIFKKENIEYIGTSLWYLNKINIVLVKRDRNWFSNNFIKIKQFWDNVKKYREEGTHSIKKQKKTY